MRKRAEVQEVPPCLSAVALDEHPIAVLYRNPPMDPKHDLRSATALPLENVVSIFDERATGHRPITTKKSNPLLESKLGKNDSERRPRIV